MTKNMSRRHFLSGSVSTAALGSLKLAWSAPMAKSHGGGSAATLVYLFLRGGIDGLNLVPPNGNSPHRANYEALRPRLQVPLSGDNPLLPIGYGWGLHPAAAGLRQLFLDGRLAIVHGTGLPSQALTRSHFDAMEMMELGTPGDLTTPDGWLTRHLATSPNVVGTEIIPTLAAGSSSPTSLRSNFDTLTIDGAGSYHPNGSRDFAASYVQAIAQMYTGGAGLDKAVQSAMNKVQVIDGLDLESYTPAGGVVYPSGTLAERLELIAQLIRLDLGLNAATVDFGGWDTHNGQGDFGGGYFAGHVGELSEAVTAFWSDLIAAGRSDEVCMVIHSDFGRRARQNGESNSGTDHGSGNVMLVIGGRVNGGIYGRFSGLANDQLFEGQDVAPVIDFRSVLATAVQEIMGNPNIDQVFPGYTGYSALGFADVNTGLDTLFESGFEG